MPYPVCVNDEGPTLLHAADTDGQTLLHAAAGAGHVDLVELLIERGAEIDHRDPCRDTPLVAATCFGHLDVAARLVQAGADVTVLPDPRSYQHHSRQHRDGDPPLDGAAPGVLEARHLPNPSDLHESILYAKPPCDRTWFYETQVHNPLAEPLRIVWFDAFGRSEDHGHPGNVKGRPLNGLDFSPWYGDGDRPLKHGVIEPGQTARCDVNWHCGWDEHPPRNKWACRAVAEDGRAFHAEAEIVSAPYPEAAS